MMSCVDAEEARTAVRQARQRHEQAEQAAIQEREHFHEVIAKVLAGESPIRVSELEDLTGYRREHLRRIARSAGVPPRR